ncbi:hypothetical protein [Enhygromyxa salina]|uniref:Uncharacterized protein n=1 Tax=Enhygromyxa salina TaxID=215803 RepID=A0A2S9YFE3_9BACT|nr:hypothetical protein [Enhygromyxa salina]PRQ03799.1 hypothetical protein ENSA7_52660 [Enhygromyxa salina]
MTSNSALGIKISGVLGLVGAGLYLATMVAAPPRGRGSSYMSMVRDWSDAPAWGIPVLVLAIVTSVAAAIMFFVSLSRSRQVPARGSADISAEVASRPLPFSVCGHCRILIDLPHAFACPRCDSATTTVRVDAEAERGIALAALGSRR